MNSWKGMYVAKLHFKAKARQVRLKYYAYFFTSKTFIVSSEGPKGKKTF